MHLFLHALTSFITSRFKHFLHGHLKKTTRFLMVFNLFLFLFFSFFILKLFPSWF